MTADAALSRRDLVRGRFADGSGATWQPVEGLAAGSGDVFWGGWADAAGLFVAGDEGAIFHFDGATWTRMDTPAPVPVHALWGNARDALWAVGWMGLILRFDGHEWHRLRGCRVNEAGKYAAAPENTPLFAIDGRPDGTAFAVGDHGTVLRWDGGDWQPETSGTRAHLRAVRCLSDGRVLAAGANGTVLVRATGGGWCGMESPVATGFNAALELDTGTVLLAGGRYFLDENGFRGDLVLLEEGRLRRLFEGARFSRFRDLAATRAGILAVGDRGAIHLFRQGEMTRVESGTPHDLHGLVPTPGGEALAVGDFGTVLVGSPAALTAFAPAVQAGPGASRWAPLDSGTDRQLWGLWTDPETGTAHACGEEGTVLIEDRGKWEALPPVGALGIHALERAPGGDLLAAGQLGEIHRFDGSSWRREFDLLMDVTILSLWSDGVGNLFAAGDEGLILRREAAGWQRMASGTRSALYALWGRDDRHLLAVGDFGLVLRWNGTRWDAFDAGTEHFLFDVWGRGLNDIFVVGLSGTIGHFDGTRWRITAARARNDLLAVSGAGASVMAVGAGGIAMLNRGGRWSLDATGIDSGLRAIAATANGGFLAAGDGGRILLREPPDIDA